LQQIHHLKSFQYFLDFVLNHMFIPLTVSIIALVLLLFQRKWLLAAYIPFYAFGFWLVIIIGMHNESSPIMLQNYYTVFGLFGGILIALAISQRKLWVHSTVVILLGMFSLKEIYQARYIYTLRTEFVQHLNDYGQQFPEKKYVLHAQHLPWEFVWINWALPFETLIQSEIDPNHESVTYFSTFELDTLDYFDVERPDAFLGAAFEPHWFAGSALNEKYFSLKSGPYRILNTLQTPQTMNGSFLRSDSLIIEPLRPTINKTEGPTSLKIRLINSSRKVLTSLTPSDSTGIHLYYRIMDSEKNIVDSENQRILMDWLPGTDYVDIITYQHPSGIEQRMEIGFYDLVRKKYYPKTSIQLNVE